MWGRAQHSVCGVIVMHSATHLKGKHFVFLDLHCKQLPLHSECPHTCLALSTQLGICWQPPQKDANCSAPLAPNSAVVLGSALPLAVPDSAAMQEAPVGGQHLVTQSEVAWQLLQKQSGTRHCHLLVKWDAPPVARHHHPVFTLDHPKFALP